MQAHQSELMIAAQSASAYLLAAGLAEARRGADPHLVPRRVAEFGTLRALAPSHCLQ
jgi:hypothetical protein